MHFGAKTLSSNIILILMHFKIPIFPSFHSTRKSCLIRQIKEPLSRVNGYFIEGKFNQRARPDFVIASALDHFLQHVLETSNDGHDDDDANKAQLHQVQLHHLQRSIRNAVGSSGIQVLMESIPSLRALAFEDGDKESSTSASSTVACASPSVASAHGLRRFKLLICKLIGALSSSSHPVVLFLDDLQRADEATLDVIEMIMVDPDIQYFLFLGCYRDNEVDEGHPLSVKLRNIQEQGVCITSIRLGPIEKECTVNLVSETLSLPPRLCQSLSLAVYGKTGGIILFFINFLTSLAQDGMLWYSLGSKRWEYNIDLIQQKDISDDVVQHMTQQMTHQSPLMQMGLKIAACLGTGFLGAHFQRVTDLTPEGAGSFLESAVEMAFLQRTTTENYMWVHDQVQQAAYEMIPINKRESFHLLLGSRLYLRTPLEDLDDLLFTIAGNMNYGLRHIYHPLQKIEVAHLNLKAGEKAIKSSSFHSAVGYLKSGLLLLGDDAWEDQYDLIIQLHDAVSEALFVSGEFSTLRSLAEAPLAKARCFEDKLGIYINIVRSLISSEKFKEGIHLCTQVLKHLGEVLPTNGTVTMDIYAREAEEVHNMVEGQSQSDLINLPMMTDQQKFVSSFILHLFLISFF
jgi:predicted ATPase